MLNNTPYWKTLLMNIAELADAWRIMPRMFAGAYAIMVFALIRWYRGMETVEQKECDDQILRTLIENGLNPVEATDLACTIIGVTGGPTAEQTAFATAIIGLSTAIFGFYVNSGRNWDRSYSYRRKGPEREPEGRYEDLN